MGRVEEEMDVAGLQIGIQFTNPAFTVAITLTRHTTLLDAGSLSAPLSRYGDPTVVTTPPCEALA